MSQSAYRPRRSGWGWSGPSYFRAMSNRSRCSPPRWWCPFCRSGAQGRSAAATFLCRSRSTPRSPGGPQLLGAYVAVIDAEGYVHLLDSNDGSLVGRLATDGAAAISQPLPNGAGAVWQSASGNLIRTNGVGTINGVRAPRQLQLMARFQF